MEALAFWATIWNAWVYSTPMRLAIKKMYSKKTAVFRRIWPHFSRMFSLGSPPNDNTDM